MNERIAQKLTLSAQTTKVCKNEIARFCNKIMASCKGVGVERNESVGKYHHVHSSLWRLVRARAVVEEDALNITDKLCKLTKKVGIIHFGIRNEDPEKGAHYEEPWSFKVFLLQTKSGRLLLEAALLRGEFQIQVTRASKKGKRRSARGLNKRRQIPKWLKAFSNSEIVATSCRGTCILDANELSSGHALKNL